jgi:hypothetical protein
MDVDEAHKCTTIEEEEEDEEEVEEGIWILTNMTCCLVSSCLLDVLADLQLARLLDCQFTQMYCEIYPFMYVMLHRIDCISLF